MNLEAKFYWVSHSNQWCIGGKSGYDNSIVQVTKRDGTTQSVALGNEIGKLNHQTIYHISRNGGFPKKSGASTKQLSAINKMIIRIEPHEPELANRFSAQINDTITIQQASIIIDQLIAILDQNKF